MNRLRNVLKGLALAAYALLLAEACVRLLDPQPLLPRYITGTEWGVRGNIPGATYRHHTPEVDVGYRINGQGMRAERDFSEAPPPHACRVGVIGDSYFVGYEVELEDTVAQRLERALQERGLPAEVLNFSVSGFGTAEMLRTYEGQMRRFAPDLVIMQWHVTDLEDNVRSGLYVPGGAGLQRGADSYLPSVALQDRLMRYRLYRLVADNSHLYSFVRERAGGAVKDLLVLLRTKEAGEPSAQPAPVAASANGPTAERLSALLLRESMQTIRSDGADFLVVDVPEPKGRERLVSVWNTLPVEELDAVPVLHAIDVFAPLLSPDRKLYFEKGHWHLTPLASGALAEAIAARVEPLLRNGRCGNRL